MPSRPSSRRQRSSTAPGVRKQVPEFTSVVPPTARPSGSTIGGLPTVVSCPASRYRRVDISRGRAVNASVSHHSPSSRTATRMPPSASSLATTAPPAPEPIMQASTRRRRSPRIDPPDTSRRSGGWNVPVPSE